ncbi:MAG: glucosamine-6-phosphate deaminase [Christensenellaceae bacterium]|jgi:glucosamine-6-phosphate deaminase|nr:glucosamine-6-phosphate deaminase [Christensenellaceae bacterium]
MEIQLTRNYDEMSEVASEIVTKLIKRKSHAILGLATGSTPIGLYRCLIDEYNSGNVSFKNVTTCNLDEYIGLDSHHDQSYKHFMNTNLFDHIDINKENTHFPNGSAEDLDIECERYSNLLTSMPRDLQILGIGRNGHIGFNEPGTPFNSTTHVVTLDKKTIADNARFFESENEVPRLAITMGISEILNSKCVLLLASGKNKREAITKMLSKSPSPKCPASALLSHPNLIVVCTEHIRLVF